MRETSNSVHDDGRHSPYFAINFKDVEGTVRKFSGADVYPVDRFINDLEDVADLFSWSDLRLYIVAKQQLVGLANRFVKGTRYPFLGRPKNLLEREFASHISSVHLHKSLSENKLQRGEDVQEYFLLMKELASRGAIEDEASIHYVIDGIPDSESNKIILYHLRQSYGPIRRLNGRQR